VSRLKNEFLKDFPVMTSAIVTNFSVT